MPLESSVSDATIWSSTLLLSITILEVSFDNEGKSTASFCRQVAAWFPDMFCNFYLVTNHKIAENSTTTKAREKISTWNPYNFFMYGRLN